MDVHREVGSLSVADYVVFAVTLIISAGIGVYFKFSGGKKTTKQDFLLAGRSMPITPVAFSLMATFKSAVAFIGFPSEMYLYGTNLFWAQFWHIAGAVVSGYLFFPAYFDLQCTTSYEFLKWRFGPVMRMIGSLAFIGQMIMHMSVVLYAPALSLSAVTSLSLWASIVSIGVVCTLYCTLGGMKAVLWTDAFQAVLMFMGLFTMIIQGCIDLGGGENVIEIAKEGGRFVIPSFTSDLTQRYTFWNIMCQGFILSTSTYGCSQIQIQRILTVKDVKKARKALFLSVAMTFTFMFLLMSTGIVMYAYFRDCDPLSAPIPRIHKNDQLLPLYIMVLLERFPGLPGLCISSIFSASLSTISSAVSSLTAVTIEDFIVPFCGNRKTSLSNSVVLAKVLTFAYGAICIMGTLVVARFGGVLQATFTIFGIFSGPLVGVFVLGMFTTTANEMGVALATLSSIAVVAWASFGAASLRIKPPSLPLSTEGCPSNSTYLTEEPDLFNTTLNSISVTTNADIPEDKMRYIFPLYTVSFMWFIVIGFVLTVIAGYCFSLVINTVRGQKPQFQPECLNPIMRKILLPKCKTGDDSEKGKSGELHVASKNHTNSNSSENGVSNLGFDEHLKHEQSTRF